MLRETVSAPPSVTQKLHPQMHHHLNTFICQHKHHIHADVSLFGCSICVVQSFILKVLIHKDSFLLKNQIRWTTPQTKQTSSCMSEVFWDTDVTVLLLVKCIKSNQKHLCGSGLTGQNRLRSCFLPHSLFLVFLSSSVQRIS